MFVFDIYTSCTVVHVAHVAHIAHVAKQPNELFQTTKSNQTSYLDLL